MTGHSEQETWPQGVRAITLFVDDIEEASDFTGRYSAFPCVLRTRTQPPSTSETRSSTCSPRTRRTRSSNRRPSLVARRSSLSEAGVRVQFTVKADDVDAMGTRSWRAASNC